MVSVSIVKSEQLLYLLIKQWKCLIYFVFTIQFHRICVLLGDQGRHVSMNLGGEKETMKCTPLLTLFEWFSLLLMTFFPLWFIDVSSSVFCLQLLAFLQGLFTFYHEGYELAHEFEPYKQQLQFNLQNVSLNSSVWLSNSSSLQTKSRDFTSGSPWD